jgi:hypothetical protein
VTAGKGEPEESGIISSNGSSRREKESKMKSVDPAMKDRKRYIGLISAAAAPCIALAAIAGLTLGHHSPGHAAAAADAAAIIPTKAAPHHTMTPTSKGPAVPSGATAAINHYETKNGPGVGKWIIGSSHLSKADPSYAFFRIVPARGFEDSVQGGFGFAHDSGSGWNVVGFGTAQVGCAGAGSNVPVVPAAVLAEFGFSCPVS